MATYQPPRIFFVAYIAVTVASCPYFVAAFQAAVAPSFLSSSASPTNNRRHGCRWPCLKTASKESTEIINDDTQDGDDSDDATADSWALRQITFLGLSAPNEEAPAEGGEGVGDGDGASKNALDARDLSEFLMEIGACSVSITDTDADTDAEDPLFDEPSLADEGWAVVISDLAAGRNLWKRCDVSAHFPPSLDVPSVVEAVRCTFHCPVGPRYKVDDVPDRDWVRHVQESWDPILTRESKFVLRFPWHDDALVMKSCQEMEMEKMQDAMKRQFSSGVKREGAVVHFESDDDEECEVVEQKKSRDYIQIQLEGGIAFGTGEHPTTRLCLDWVRDKVEDRLNAGDDGDSIHFLDYGAGSGVLGIAAASVVRDYNQSKCRRKNDSKKVVTTIGVEIDADAILIADENANRNNVDMKNYLPDLESLDGEALSVVLRAMHRRGNQGAIQTLPDELNQPIYDLCAANILAAPLINLAPTIASLVKSPGGEIGLSGVLATHAESVVEAYGEFFHDVKVAGDDGGWVLITGKRR